MSINCGARSIPRFFNFSWFKGCVILKFSLFPYFIKYIGWHCSIVNFPPIFIHNFLASLLLDVVILVFFLQIFNIIICHIHLYLTFLFNIFIIIRLQVSHIEIWMKMNHSWQTTIRFLSISLDLLWQVRKIIDLFLLKYTSKYYNFFYREV